MKNTILKTINSIIEIKKGMFTVLKHIFRPAITLEYPEKKPELNSRFKGRVALLLNQDGSEVCIGCKTCAKVCPCGDLIYIESGKNADNKPIVEKYTIDIGRCIFCGNCRDICPVGAIVMTDEYEFADYSRKSFVLDKKKITLSVKESEKWMSLRSKGV